MNVFISHASADAVVAGQVRDLLKGLGYETWLAPEDLVGASSWAEQILAAVGRCDALVVLLSDAANRSDHVAREVSIAAEAGKTIVPLRLAAIEPDGSLRYLLHLSQRLDVFPHPLTSYRDRIKQAVEGGVGQRLVARRRSRSAPLIAGAVVLAVALSVVAWIALRDDDADGAAVSDLLNGVPTSIEDWTSLSDTLRELGAAAGLDDGDPVELVRSENDSGSVAFYAPSTWTDVQTSEQWVDSNGTLLGDLLRVSIQKASFEGGREGGLFVGAAPTTALVPNGLDSFQPPEYFLGLGCVQSELIQVAEPFPGEARLWSDCNNTPRIYVSALLVEGDIAAYVFGLVATREEAEALIESLQSLEIDGTPLA